MINYGWCVRTKNLVTFFDVLITFFEKKRILIFIVRCTNQHMPVKFPVFAVDHLKPGFQFSKDTESALNQCQ